MRLSPNEFSLLVAEALRTIPAGLRTFLEEIVVDVEPMPDDRVCDAAGIDDPRDLLGFYEGVPLPERSLDEPLEGSGRIIIYQRNIEHECRSREDVVRQIRTTVLHEVGHHFGLDERDLEELGYD